MSVEYWYGRVLEDGKWCVLRGWHVFRHSFASDCAAAIDQRVIDATRGHQAEEIRKRSCHLFPHQQEATFAAVFGA